MLLAPGRQKVVTGDIVNVIVSKVWEDKAGMWRLACDIADVDEVSAGPVPAAAASSVAGAPDVAAPSVAAPCAVPPTVAPAAVASVQPVVVGATAAAAANAGAATSTSTAASSSNGGSPVCADAPSSPSQAAAAPCVASPPGAGTAPRRSSDDCSVGAPGVIMVGGVVVPLLPTLHSHRSAEGLPSPVDVDQRRSDGCDGSTTVDAAPQDENVAAAAPAAATRAVAATVSAPAKTAPKLNPAAKAFVPLAHSNTSQAQ